MRLILICEFGFECMQANEDAILNENINIQNDKSSRIDHRKIDDTGQVLVTILVLRYTG